jgi:hypothetical protein
MFYFTQKTKNPKIVKLVAVNAPNKIAAVLMASEKTKEKLKFVKEI